MSIPTPAIHYVMNNEGQLVESNKFDAGGISKYGISLRFLKSLDETALKKYSIFGLPDENTIIELNMDQAFAIYLYEFWQHAPYAQIINQDLANYYFDMSVNMGLAPSTKALQRACWATLGNKHSLKDDGILGRETIDAINNYPEVLYALKSERAGNYRVIVATNESQEIFLNGWLERAYK